MLSNTSVDTSSLKEHGICFMIASNDPMGNAQIALLANNSTVIDSVALAAKALADEYVATRINEDPRFSPLYKVLVLYDDGVIHAVELSHEDLISIAGSSSDDYIRGYAAAKWSNTLAQNPVGQLS